MYKLNLKIATDIEIFNDITTLLNLNNSPEGLNKSEEEYLKTLQLEEKQRKVIANSQVCDISITNSDLLKIVDDEIKFMDNKFKTEIGDFNKIGINFKKLDLNNCSYKEIEDERNELIHADDHGVKLVDEELQYLKELTAEFVRRGGIIGNHINNITPIPKTVLKRKLWKVECIDFSDGTSQMNRTNDGFNILELKGLVALLDAELHDQFKSLIKPDIIKRETIID